MTDIDPFNSPNADPLALFHAWLNEARASEINDPNAMSLATSTPGGAPSVRIVLCKRADSQGFTFYTNRESRKGGELLANPKAAICFHWKSLQRQVRATGTVTEVSSSDADEYFGSRYRISQIGAWASQQSRPLDSRDTLEARTAEFEAKYPDAVPRPGYWTGFTLRPDAIEFWQERPYRLHDRVVFTRDGDGWAVQRLYP
jgi:pyridoxamine 5'-phosphate oxidase